jgi:peroxiredoxin
MVQSRKWIPFVVAAMGVGGVTLFAWVSRDSLRPVEIGEPAPDFLAFDMSGQEVSLEDYRGKVVLLNLWATWCTPCKEEMPSIQRLYGEVNDEDFLVLAVSIDRAPADDDRTNPLGGKLTAFADSLGLTFPVLHDPSAEISTTYRTTGVPESFVLDREGVIMRKITGPMAWDAPQNVEFIRRLLNGGSRTPQ